VGDDLRPRKFPKPPKSGNIGPENPRTPYIGPGDFGGIFQEAPSSDLFGLEQCSRKPNERQEAAALVEVLKALRAHRAVAWCNRMNSGATRVGSRFIRFGWRGCPDVLGQLKDGRFLGVEVKAATGRLRAEQRVFLERVRESGGVAFVARDCRDVTRELLTEYSIIEGFCNNE
jgi:hypothetical protein